MSGIATAILASPIASSIGVSALVGAGASVAATKSASKNAKQQRQSDEATRDLNFRQFKESRGSEGSAVLPTYFRRDNGDLFEEELGGDIISLWDKTRNDVDYDGVRDGFRDSQNAANTRGKSIFNGGLRDEMLSNFEPVKNARVKFSRQSALDALSKTLAEIELKQSRKGYQGDSYGARRLRFDANLEANKEVSRANLSNLNEERQIRDAILKLQLDNLDQPARSARNALDFESLPGKAEIDLFNARMSPLSMLRIGPGQFKYENINQGYTPSTTAALLSGLSQGGASIASVLAEREQARKWEELANRYSGSGYGNSSLWSPTSAVENAATARTLFDAPAALTSVPNNIS